MTNGSLGVHFVANGVDRIYRINGILREKSCSSFPVGSSSIQLILSFLSFSFSEK